jgi:hypothetical protein
MLLDKSTIIQQLTITNALPKTFVFDLDGTIMRIKS